MKGFHKTRSFVAMLVLVTFVFQLCSPALIYAADRERWDRVLLDRLAGRIHRILDKVCEIVSSSRENSLVMKTFLCDEHHRVFADISGHIVIKFPVLSEKSRQKIEGSAGSWLSTNGPLSVDFCITDVKKTGDRQYAIDFQLDIVLTLKNAVRTMFSTAASVIGAVTIGAALSKVVTYFETIDAETLGLAVKKATAKLWVLTSGKTAVQAYDVLDQTGHVSVRGILVEGITARSIIYHFGVFILKAGVSAGASVANLSFGAAVGASLSAQVGAFVGAALAVAAIGIIGSIVIDKVMRDFPMWYKFKRLKALHARLLRQQPGSDEYRETESDIEEYENQIVVWIDNEIITDKYLFMNKLTKKLGKIAKEGDLAPYEGVIVKLLNKLKFATVNDSNWNAARKYYQLLKAIDRLPDLRKQP